MKNGMKKVLKSINTAPTKYSERLVKTIDVCVRRTLNKQQMNERMHCTSSCIDFYVLSLETHRQTSINVHLKQYL